MSELDNTQPSDGNTTNTEQTDVNEGSEKTFTQEQFGQKISAERKKMAAQYEKEKQKALDEAKAEWERQAKLTDEQKATEAQKAKEKALEERERQVTLRERQAEATTKLSEKNIPVAFVEYVLDEDADKMAAKIDTLSKTWSDELKKAVKGAVSGNTPEDKNKGDLGKKTTTSSSVYRGDGSSVI